MLPRMQVQAPHIYLSSTIQLCSFHRYHNPQPPAPILLKRESNDSPRMSPLCFLPGLLLSVSTFCQLLSPNDAFYILPAFQVVRGAAILYCTHATCQQRDQYWSFLAHLTSTLQGQSCCQASSYYTMQVRVSLYAYNPSTRRYTI